MLLTTVETSIDSASLSIDSWLELCAKFENEGGDMQHHDPPQSNKSVH